MSELWTHLCDGVLLICAPGAKQFRRYAAALAGLGNLALLCPADGHSEKRVCRWALFCYLFFFFKEFIRVTRSVADFSCCFSLPYWDVLFTLVLPHGAIEYLAFALGQLMPWPGSAVR